MPVETPAKEWKRPNNNAKKNKIQIEVRKQSDTDSSGNIKEKAHNVTYCNKWVCNTGVANDSLDTNTDTKQMLAQGDESVESTSCESSLNITSISCRKPEYRGPESEKFISKRGNNKHTRLQKKNIH